MRMQLAEMVPIPPLQETHPEDDAADAQGNNGQALAEVRQASQQGSAGLTPLLQERGDLAELSGHAGGHYHPTPMAVGHHRALVGHVAAVAEGPCVTLDGHDALLRRHRLPCEGRLVCPQALPQKSVLHALYYCFSHSKTVNFALDFDF
jgi:hypothetical protein